MPGDALRICQELLAADPCVASAHVVDAGGALVVSVPANIDARVAPEVSALGATVARGDRPRPCIRSDVDALMSCIGMSAGDGEALVVYFFFDAAVARRLPAVMARAVAQLRARGRGRPPNDGGSGGTPNEARAWVSIRDQRREALRFVDEPARAKRFRRDLVEHAREPSACEGGARAGREGVDAVVQLARPGRRARDRSSILATAGRGLRIFERRSTVR